MPNKPDKNMSRMLDFEQIKVGDTAELQHTLTQADVDTFAALTGDFNPLHLDREYAKKTDFRKPVVYGMLSASFISTMIGMAIPGGGALWTKQTIEFLHPAFVGDTLMVKATVKQKSPAIRTLVLSIEITNQNKQMLISGESTVKMLKLKKETKMENKKKQTVLITGGSRGIGAATAHKLAENGHKVVINYHRSQSDADLLVEKIRQSGGSAIAVQADIASPKEVENLFETAQSAFGPILALVHCAAGGSTLQPFLNLDWQNFQSQIEVQLKGAYNCLQNIIPQMLENKFGSIVLIGSIVTDGVPPLHQSEYVAAKAALSALGRSLAMEYGPRGIRINMVAPGMTQTDMIANLPDKAKMLTRMQSPLRRLGEPEDIANVIAFLLDPASRHITGETIRVAGGAVMI